MRFRAYLTEVIRQRALTMLRRGSAASHAFGQVCRHDFPSRIAVHHATEIVVQRRTK